MPSAYYEKALIKAQEYRKKQAPLILGIESSCDETAAASASPAQGEVAPQATEGSLVIAKAIKKYVAANGSDPTVVLALLARQLPLRRGAGSAAG